MEEIIIDKDTMQQIARFEQTFEEYLSPEAGRIDLSFPESYAMTIDDLMTAIRNMQDGETLVTTATDFWYFMLSGIRPQFGIPEDYRNDEGIRGLPVSDGDALMLAWERLGEILSAADDPDGTPACDLPGLDGIIEDLALYLRERKNSVISRYYSDPQKERFISDFTDGLRVSKATETELLLCRSFVQQLLPRGNEAALRVMAYASYGGNRLFPCNWETSRGCLTELYAKTEDPQALCSLGYIYYYGRCSEGRPDYALAYQAFSVAAACGLHEGMYKLGDLFRFGFGCRKNEKAARSLYGMVYHDCREQFLDGFNVNFADAARRMGDVFLYGISEDKDPMLALIYYAQAEYALTLKEFQDFGDEDVSEKIQAAITEAEQQLPDESFGDCQLYPWAEPFRVLVSDGYRAELSMEQKPNGRCVFHAARIPRPGRFEARPILIDLPAARTCARTAAVSLECEDAEALFVSDAPGRLLFDYCTYLPSEHATEFYYDGKRIGRIRCEAFRLFP